MVWAGSTHPEGDLALSPRSRAPAAAPHPQGLLLPAHFGTRLQHSFRLEDLSSAFTTPPPSPHLHLSYPSFQKILRLVRHEATHRGAGRVLTWNAQRKGRRGMGFKSRIAPCLRQTPSLSRAHAPTVRCVRLVNPEWSYWSEPQ